MDTTRDITYRAFVLNDEDITENVTGGGADGTGISGCVVDSVQWSDVDVVQWLEKRSQTDGSDAGDVFQGVRRIRMAGTLYATTKLELWDSIWQMRAALNPVLAQREEPLDKGYRPLYFSVPTNDNVNWPEGAIPLMIRALPRGIDHVHGRDNMGGEDINPLAMPWQASFICRDPGIYVQDPVTVDFDTYNAVVTGATIAVTNIITKASHGLVVGDRVTFYSLTGGTGLSTGVTYYVIASGLTSSTFKVSLTSGGTEVDVTVLASAASYVKSTTFSGSWTNRGTYLGLFEALFVVEQGGGSIVATVGDSAFTITVPASTGERTIRVKQVGNKLLTFEESNDEQLQMSRIAFASDTTWPLVDPGVSSYTVSFHGMAGLGAGGRMWFYEQFA